MRYEYDRESTFIITPPDLGVSLLHWQSGLADSDPWKRVTAADTDKKVLILVRVSGWDRGLGMLETLPNDAEGRPLAHEWATDFDVVERASGRVIERVRQTDPDLKCSCGKDRVVVSCPVNGLPMCKTCGHHYTADYQGMVCDLYMLRLARCTGARTSNHDQALRSRRGSDGGSAAHGLR